MKNWAALSIRGKTKGQRIGKAQNAGFTLSEVVLSLLITGLGLGATLSLYVNAAMRTEWSAYALSAQMMAVRGLEQCRAAKYDPRGSPPTDNLQSTNFPVVYDVLDAATANGAITYGTNFTTISTIFTNPPLKMVKVDCVWRFPLKGLYTNSVCTYRAANQ